MESTHPAQTGMRHASTTNSLSREHGSTHGALNARSAGQNHLLPSRWTRAYALLLLLLRYLLLRKYLLLDRSGLRSNVSVGAARARTRLSFNILNFDLALVFIARRWLLPMWTVLATFDKDQFTIDMTVAVGTHRGGILLCLCSTRLMSLTGASTFTSLLMAMMSVSMARGVLACTFALRIRRRFLLLLLFCATQDTRRSLTNQLPRRERASNESNDWHTKRELTREPFDLDFLLCHLHRGVDGADGDVDESS